MAPRRQIQLSISRRIDGVDVPQESRRSSNRNDIIDTYMTHSARRADTLTTPGYVQIEKEAVLALVRQEDDHLLQLLVPAERHLRERGGVIGEIRVILRADRAERVRQLDAVPRYRRDRRSQPQIAHGGCGVGYTAEHFDRVEMPAVELLQREGRDRILISA